MAGIFALSVALLPVAASASARPADVTQSSHFVWVATAANSSGSSTEINNGASNGLPNALLFVTSNYNPGGVCNCVYDTSPLGVVYDSTVNLWAVFNEDNSAMEVGAAFNVLVVPSATSTAFVQTATNANSDGDLTSIASTTGQSKDVLQVTPRWNGAYEDDPIGVAYYESEWAVFNEDLQTMATNAQYNVLVGTTGTGGGKSLVQKSTANNIVSDGTTVSSSVVNGDPNAFVLDTPNGGPNGKRDTSPTGVYSNGESMLVFNEQTTAMKANEGFNLLMYNS